jgi:hypothetical protein
MPISEADMDYDPAGRTRIVSADYEALILTAYSDHAFRLGSERQTGVAGGRTDWNRAVLTCISPGATAD